MPLAAPPDRLVRQDLPPSKAVLVKLRNLTTLGGLLSLGDLAQVSGVFFGFGCLFLLFRSQNYLAVDGAVRCLGVYHRPNVFFHGNNHLLYPLNILTWYRFLTVLGLQPKSPVEFISLMQVMNCLAGAGCLAILYFLMHVVTSSRQFITCIREMNSTGLFGW